MSETFKIPDERLRGLRKRVSFLDPREQDVEYQLSEQKRQFDSVTIGYYQFSSQAPSSTSSHRRAASKVLHIRHSQVSVKKVTLDIELDASCGRD